MPNPCKWPASRSSSRLTRLLLASRRSPESSFCPAASRSVASGSKAMQPYPKKTHRLSVVLAWKEISLNEIQVKNNPLHANNFIFPFVWFPILMYPVMPSTIFRWSPVRHHASARQCVDDKPGHAAMPGHGQLERLVSMFWEFWFIKGLDLGCFDFWLSGPPVNSWQAALTSTKAFSLTLSGFVRPPLKP